MEKKIHYGIEFGDFREEGLDTRKFVCISCRNKSNSLIKDWKYTMNENKVTCKKCMKRIAKLNSQEEVEKN